MVKYNILIFSFLLMGTLSGMDQPKKRKISLIKNAGIGVAAAAAEITIDQPLVYWKNMIQSGKRIDWARPQAFYRGAGVNLASLAPTTAIQVAINGLLNDIQAHYPLRQMVNAWLAGAMSAIVSSPSEALILHQQMSGKNAFETAKNLWKQFGKTCLTRGILPTCIRDGGFACGFLALGPAAKEYLKQYSDNQILGMCGLVGAGLIAAGGTHMFDLTKTVMQKDLASNKGMINIMRHIVATEGYKGLFKGLIPRSMRVAMAIPIMSTVTEHLQRYNAIDE